MCLVHTSHYRDGNIAKHFKHDQVGEKDHGKHDAVLSFSFLVHLHPTLATLSSTSLATHLAQKTIHITRLKKGIFECRSHHTIELPHTSRMPSGEKGQKKTPCHYANASNFERHPAV